jgi:hypothetical protein
MSKQPKHFSKRPKIYIKASIVQQPWVRWEQPDVSNEPWAKPPTNAQETCHPECNEGSGLAYLLTIDDARFLIFDFVVTPGSGGKSKICIRTSSIVYHKTRVFRPFAGSSLTSATSLGPSHPQTPKQRVILNAVKGLTWRIY